MATALIDADIVCYQASAAAQRDFGDEVWTDVAGAFANAKEEITKQMEGAECTEVILCFSPKNGSNFRKLVLKTYKMNRKKTPKPICYQELRNRLEKKYVYKSIDWLEADDLMSLLNQQIDDSVIVSIDKDMGAVPGVWFNPMKMVWAEETTLAKADYNWLFQTLKGDTTDGYKGLYMCGDKKAAVILSPFYNVKIINDVPVDSFDFVLAWEAVVDAYKLREQEDYLVQARVARILRSGDFDLKNKRIKLFNPDKEEWLQLP